MANISMQVHEQLDRVQKQFQLFDRPPTLSLEPRRENSTQIDSLQFESTLLDRIRVRSRAGLFAYFNASVSSEISQTVHATDILALRETADR